MDGSLHSVDQTKNAMTETCDPGMNDHRDGRRHDPFVFNVAKRGSFKRKLSAKGEKRRYRISPQNDQGKGSDFPPVSSHDGPFIHKRKLSDGWQNLSEEEIDLLEIDIFKPLDFYAILMDRMKTNDNGRIIHSMNELWE